MQSSSKHFWKLVYCVVLTGICFSFQNAGKSITFNIYTRAGLDYVYPLQFTINYFISPITLFFVEAILRRLKLGLVLYLGTFSCMSFLFGALIVTSCFDNSGEIYCRPAFQLSMISLETLLGGISGCLFYVGYPVYVNSLASSQQKAFYFGFAYSIWNISGVLGNTIGYYSSGAVDPFYFYLYLIVGLLSFQLFFLCLPDVRNRENYDPDMKKPLMKDQLEKLRSVFSDAKFRNFVPLFFLVCMVTVSNTKAQGSYFNFLPQLLKSIQMGTNKNEYTHLAYIYGGVGQLAGGLFFSTLEKIIKIIPTSFAIVLVIFAQIFMSCLGQIYLNLQYAYIAAFFGGLFLSSGNALIATIVSKHVCVENKYFVCQDMLSCAGIGFSSLIYLILNKLSIWTLVSILGVQGLGMVFCLWMALGGLVEKKGVLVEAIQSQNETQIE